MGMEVTIYGAAGLTWPTIRERIGAAGLAFSIRMIDDLPAFPDETPEDGWREVRLSLPSGMVTLRKAGADLKCVVWGNADPALLADRDRLQLALTSGEPQD